MQSIGVFLYLNKYIYTYLYMHVEGYNNSFIYSSMYKLIDVLHFSESMSARGANHFLKSVRDYMTTTDFEKSKNLLNSLEIFKFLVSLNF